MTSEEEKKSFNYDITIDICQPSTTYLSHYKDQTKWKRKKKQIKSNID